MDLLINHAISSSVPRGTEGGATSGIPRAGCTREESATPSANVGSSMDYPVSGQERLDGRDPSRVPGPRAQQTGNLARNRAEPGSDSTATLSVESQRGSEAHLWLVKALNEAERAVQLDNHSEFGKALFAYQNTVLYLLNVLDRLSTGHQDPKNGRWESIRDERYRVIQLRDMYISRINVLLKSLPHEYSVTYNSRIISIRKNASPTAKCHPEVSPSPPLSTKRRHFARIIHQREVSQENKELHAALKGEPLLSVYRLPKEELALIYPYWLMSRFALSMVSGAYLTPNLHVPSELWSQKNYRVPAMEQKIEICNIIVIHLNHMQKVNPNDYRAVERELSSCIAALEHVQLLFSKRISTIDYQSRKKSYRQFSKLIEVSSTAPSEAPLQVNKGRIMESVGFAINKSLEFICDQINPKPTGLSLYTRSLLKVFYSAQILNKWIFHYKSIQEKRPPEMEIISRQLSTVSYLFSSVICTFVLKDFHIISEHFLKKVSASIFA